MIYLKKAKEALSVNNYTCVIMKDEVVFITFDRGVKPLVKLIRDGKSFKDFYAADKVVGKATAFLYLLLQVKGVYARVISKSALSLLQKHGVTVEYDELTENIVNRKGNGICPFEASVLDVTEPSLAYLAILRKMEEMKILLE